MTILIVTISNFCSIKQARINKVGVYGRDYLYVSSNTIWISFLKYRLIPSLSRLSTVES